MGNFSDAHGGREGGRDVVRSWILSTRTYIYTYTCFVGFRDEGEGRSEWRGKGSDAWCVMCRRWEMRSGFREGRLMVSMGVYTYIHTYIHIEGKKTVK